MVRRHGDHAVDDSFVHAPGGETGLVETSAGATTEVREHLNVRLFVWSWVLGASLVGAAFATEGWLGWVGVSTETMVSIGSIFLLAGAIFLLERHFVVRVSAAVERAAIHAVDERISAATHDTTVRLHELEERMAELIAEQSTQQDAAVRDLVDPTYEHVADALAVANATGAITFGHVTVQGSTDFNELGLEFSWMEDKGTGRFAVPPGARLRIKAEVYADEHVSGGKPYIEVEWTPAKTALDVGQELRDQLIARGRWNGDDTLRWQTALQNLQVALDLAIRSRRRESEFGLLQGALNQLVGEWAVTEAGIECPARGFLFPESEHSVDDHENPRSAIKRTRAGDLTR